MRTALRLSIFSNLSLLGLLVFLLLAGPYRVSPLAPLPVATQPPRHEAAAVMAHDSRRDEPTSFRWSQLEAKDYHVYVKNLRAAGCPEASVRAIVVADVQVAYRVRARELEQKISELRASSWTNQLATVGADTELKSALQQIPDEETAMINDLLGLPPAPGQPPAEMAAWNRQPRPEPPIVLPLAMQEVDVSGLALSDDQKQAIANVRQEFLEQIGGASQNPDDPAYLQRWQNAQPAADNLLLGFLGNQAYTEYQVRAYQLSLEKQAAATPQE
jgi:hypothetical protein